MRLYHGYKNIRCKSKKMCVKTFDLLFPMIFINNTSIKMGPDILFLTLCSTSIFWETQKDSFCVCAIQFDETKNIETYKNLTDLRVRFDRCRLQMADVSRRDPFRLPSYRMKNDVTPDRLHSSLHREHISRGWLYNAAFPFFTIFLSA